MRLDSHHKYPTHICQGLCWSTAYTSLCAVRELVCPRVTEQCVSPSMHSASKARPGTQGSAKGSAASETHSQSGAWNGHSTEHGNKNQPKALSFFK